MIDKSYVEKLTARLSVIESELSDPSTAANHGGISLLVEHSHLRELNAKATKYFSLVQELEDSRACLTRCRAEGDGTGRYRARGESSACATRPHDGPSAADPADSRNTILEIRAGTGGEEAALFAGDLYRMYSRFAERQGWKVGLIDAAPPILADTKNHFCRRRQGCVSHSEVRSGGHRVQRIPLTEANGGFNVCGDVAVLPEATEIDEIEVKPDEIRIDLYRASGRRPEGEQDRVGGPHHAHAVGYVVQSQDERSQQRNRERAMSVLKARLLDRARNEEQAKMPVSGNCNRVWRPQRAHPDVQLPAEPRDRSPYRDDDLHAGSIHGR